MKILCMSHGTMAEGLVKSAKMIIGNTEFLESMSAYENGEKDIDKKISEFIKKNYDQTIIVCTDIFDGSINKTWMKYMRKYNNLYLIAGMSLPLIIELVINIQQSPNKNINKIIFRSIKKAKDNVKFCNYLDFKTVRDEF